MPYIIPYTYLAPNFVVNKFRDFRKIEMITKILSTEIFSPMGVSTRVAMNYENCCLEEAGKG